MPPRRHSFREVSRKLKVAGFQVTEQRGSHVKFGRQTAGGYVTTVVPRHGEIAIGTLRSILRQAGLTWDEFDRL